MKNMNKKPIYIVLFALDIIATIFLFVVSIIMLATMPDSKAELDAGEGFINYLQRNPTIFLVAFVIPLFLLLAGNIVILVRYVRKVTAQKKVALQDLSVEEKEALRRELLKDIAKEAEAPAEANEKAPEEAN